MSVVSGVTLLTSCVEAIEGDVLTLLEGVELKRLDEAYGGTKHPQQYVFGAGINHASDDEIAARVIEHQWESPENVVLIIQPEEGQTRIWRFVGKKWTELQA
jgi:hypothetical protein